MAAGKAVDSALAHFSHQFREGRRPSLRAIDRIASETLDEELEASMLILTPDDRERQLREISGVLRAFRGSELFGLPRPKSRLVLIDGVVGIYAQPDYWNGRDRFYEMKSFHADTIAPEVLLQIRIFQLAFPNFDSILAEFDRHADPVRTLLRTVPVPDMEGRRMLLGKAREIGAASGQQKVLEYIENPVVRYDSTG